MLNPRSTYICQDILGWLHIAARKLQTANKTATMDNLHSGVSATAADLAVDVADGGEPLLVGEAL